MTVLVTGATGNVGSHVVRALRGRGVPVRAFVRDPAQAPGGVEVAVGDFEDAGSIRAAMAGVGRVFLSSGDGPRKAEHEAAVIDAAAAAGARLIVKASTIGAEAGSPLKPFDWNGRAEEHLRRSGVPWAILQSCFYMTNLMAAAEPVRAGTLPAPAGSGRIAMIDPRDVAAVAATLLSTDARAERTYRLTGPEAIGYERVAEELARATGADVRYVDMPPDVAHAGLVAAGMPDWLVAHLDGVFGLIRAGALEETTDTVQTVTGREPRGFAEFARDHARVFSASAASAANINSPSAAAART
jgi:uncharacterized protein YbjT (DUF2867 family)